MRGYDKARGKTELFGGKRKERFCRRTSHKGSTIDGPEMDQRWTRDGPEIDQKQGRNGPETGQISGRKPNSGGGALDGGRPK